MAKDKKVEPEAALLLQNRRRPVLDDQRAKDTAPFLVDLLEARWKDGKVTRQPAVLRITIEGSSIIVNISCPTEGEQTSFAIESLTTLCQEAEKILTEGKCLWTLTWDRKKKMKPELESLIE